MKSYHSRLRQLAATCEFTDVAKEFKSQIIQTCISIRSVFVEKHLEIRP